jgi:hypothetical protein
MHVLTLFVTSFSCTGTWSYACPIPLQILTMEYYRIVARSHIPGRFGTGKCSTHFMSQSLTEGFFFQGRSYNSRKLLSVWSLNCSAQVRRTLRCKTISILVFGSMLHTEPRANISMHMASVAGKEHPCCA